MRAQTFFRFLSSSSAVALLVAACTVSEPTRVATSVDLTGGRKVASEFQDGAIWVCQLGGPNGTYNYHVDATGGGESVFSAGGQDFSIVFPDPSGSMACAQAWTPTNGDSWVGQSGTVTVTQLVPDGQIVDSVQIRDSRNSIWLPTLMNTPTVVRAVDEVNNYYYFKFYNEALCTDKMATNYGQALPCTYPEDTPCPSGSFTYTYLTPSGDLFIKYDQFPAPNDNSYGTNAVGWANGHKFSDLVGSDHAGFQLVDPNGVVKLSFNVDYISANSSAPSGYASLGVSGGDGKMIVGTADGITATSSLANNLNNINIAGLFNAAHVQQFGSVNVLLNSPPTDAAHTTYVISDASLAGWDFHDTYYVTISAAKLASIGFDPNTWSVQPNPAQLHNSPAKACPPSGASIAATKYEVKDKQVKVTIQNSGGAPVYVTDVAVNWPALNGKLMQIKLDGDVMYNVVTAAGPLTLTTSQLATDQNKRKIDKNSSDVFTLVFEKNASKDLSLYAGTVSFGSINLTVLPK